MGIVEPFVVPMDDEQKVAIEDRMRSLGERFRTIQGKEAVVVSAPVAHTFLVGQAELSRRERRARARAERRARR
jgi:hypothetical protein